MTQQTESQVRAQEHFTQSCIPNKYIVSIMHSMTEAFKLSGEAKEAELKSLIARTGAGALSVAEGMDALDDLEKTDQNYNQYSRAIKGLTPNIK